MDTDPVNQLPLPSRKRARPDDPASFNLPHSVDTASNLPKSSRIRDPVASDLISSPSPTAPENAIAIASSLPSSTPVLQPIHPPIPNFQTISQAPTQRPHNSSQHHHTNVAEQTQGIFNTVLPLPNPGRAHRFCQACDHVNHVRRKVCVNCGAPKPSAVRNAVGVRPVEGDAHNDRLHRIDEVTVAPASSALANTSSHMSTSSPLTSTPDVYNHSRMPDPSDHSQIGVATSTAPPSSTFMSYRHVSPQTHQTHSLAMHCPGDDIPLPPSFGRPRQDGLGNHQSLRVPNTVLADPLVNPNQLPAHNMSPNSFIFQQKTFGFPNERSGENYTLPSVHNNVTRPPPPHVPSPGFADGIGHNRQPHPHGGPLDEGNDSGGFGATPNNPIIDGARGIYGSNRVSVLPHPRPHVSLASRYGDHNTRQQSYQEGAVVEAGDTQEMLPSGHPFYPNISTSLRTGSHYVSSTNALPSPSQLHGQHRIDDVGGGVGGGNETGSMVSNGIESSMMRMSHSSGPMNMLPGGRGEYDDNRVHRNSGIHGVSHYRPGSVENNRLGIGMVRGATSTEEDNLGTHTGRGLLEDRERNSQRPGSKLNIPRPAGGEMDGNATIDTGVRASDEGRFALGSILMPEKTGVPGVPRH